MDNRIGKPLQRESTRLQSRLAGQFLIFIAVKYAKTDRDPVIFVHGNLINESCHQHLFLVIRALVKGGIPPDQNGLQMADGFQLLQG